MGSPSVVRRCKPPCGVAGFLWNQWQLSPGISGNLRMESMAGFPWNQWQPSCGTGGSFAVESVAGVVWNTHWLYYRFPLSYRDVQELLCERGIDVTHEATRQWCLKFGQDYANQLKHRRAQPGDKWHLEIVFTQLIKTREFATRTRRDDVPDFHVAVVD